MVLSTAAIRILYEEQKQAFERPPNNPFKVAGMEANIRLLEHVLEIPKEKRFVLVPEGKKSEESGESVRKTRRAQR